MWRMVLFAVIATSIWGAAHAHVAWSLSRYVRRPRLRHIIWGLTALSFSVTLVAFMLRRSELDPAVLDVLQLVSYVGMGGFALLWSLVFLRDLFVVLAAFGRRMAGRFGDDGPSAVGDVGDAPAEPSRREFFHGMVNSSVVSAAALGVVYGHRQATGVPAIVEVDVPVDGLADDLDGLRIAQISDTHIGPTLKGDWLRAVVERTNAAEPDVIAFTGDMIDGEVADLRPHTEHIADLRATYGAYYVTGNHEYYWDAPGWCDEVARCGLHVLNNAHRVVEVGAARLLVGGVTDYRAGSRIDGHDSDPHRAIEGAPEVDFSLLLAHQPKSVWKAAEAGFDLQLSGHTHGGQFWPWNLVVGLAHPFTRGLHDYESMKIYVSCGSGYWGPPMRLGAPAEIALLTLRKA